MKHNFLSQKNLDKPKNLSKSAQIEMIGLVIVVVILSIGLLFYVKFVVFKTDPVKADTTVENAYVTNLMGAIFNIKVCDNSPIKIQDAIIDCYNDLRVCEQDACEYVKLQTEDIISLVGEKKYNNYSVWVNKSGDVKFILDQCKVGLLTYTTLITPERDHYTAFFRVC